jgi:diguanylate cyclase (GGDEF)-like protein
VLGEVSSEHGNGFPVEITVSLLSGDHEHLLAVQLRDLSGSPDLGGELNRLAYVDPVTHLPNRYATLRHLSALMSEAEPFTAIYFNFDRFRVLKNSLGHSFADKVLRAVSQRIKTVFGETAWLSRLGNDEFFLILPSLSGEKLKQATADIQAALSHDLTVDERSIHLTASIGVVAASSPYYDPGEIMSDAEIAAFQAKIAGGATYAIFDQPMRDVLVDLQHTETDLRAAVQQGDQLFVAYQPIVDLRKGGLAGFEALARWTHPERGRIPPNEFIPIAEATGLINQIGADILTKSLREAQKWMKQTGPAHMPFISVNLSLRQLSDRHFIEHTRELLRETGIPPSKLKLEITESMLMTNPEESIFKLEELRALGLELSIDDFGTGYSSLAYLHRLPVKNLKIDRSFVMRIGEPNDREIVRIITELAGILDLAVVAEGVETAEDVAILQGLNCNYGQGFYFSKPVEAHEAEKLLRHPTWSISAAA